MYIPLLPVFSPWSMFRVRAQNNDWEHIQFYRRGLDALVATLTCMKEAGCQSVLLPAYICATVTRTIVALGLRTYFYEITHPFRISLDQIETMVRARKVHAVLVVHYFGFPQPIIEVANWCRENGVFLLEDCAHVLLTPLNYHDLGAFGDVAIFSLWKMFPVVDGGALRVNNKALKPLPPYSHLCIWETLAEVLKESLRWVLWKGQLSPALFAKFPTEGVIVQSYHVFSSGGRVTERVKPMSAISRRIFQSQSWDEIVALRRRNFSFWLENLPKGERLRPLYNELPHNVVPFCFPVLIHDRDRVREAMRQRGIYLGAGFPEAPVVPRAMRDMFPYSQYLARHLLELPVHQHLQLHHLKRIADSLRRVLL